MVALGPAHRQHRHTADRAWQERGAQSATMLSADSICARDDQPAATRAANLRVGWIGGAAAEIKPDLSEWDYGDYEGKRVLTDPAMQNPLERITDITQSEFDAQEPPLIVKMRGLADFMDGSLIIPHLWKAEHKNIRFAKSS
jgi:hypothetical protein